MLNAVKERLKITWDDEDAYLLGVIGRGKARLNNLTGVELDYETEDDARALLLDLCRYDYNNALEYFEENFASEILRLQLLVGVRELGADTEADEV